MRFPNLPSHRALKVSRTCAPAAENSPQSSQPPGTGGVSTTYATSARRRRVRAETNNSPLESYNNPQRATSQRMGIHMTTTNGTPVKETSLQLREATSWAENIVHTAINMKAADRLSGAALRLWDAAVPLWEGGETASPDHRQAVKLSLDALIMQPEVLAWVAREARDHLAKVEAADGAPVEASTPEDLAVPRYHQLAGVNFFLDRDGSLAIDEREGGQPLIKLTPDEVYGVLVFMRLPGVATLIERVDARRQEAWLRGFQQDQAEEAARVMNRDQALEWLQKDDWVRGQMIGVCIDHIKRMIEKEEPAAEAR